MSPFSSIALSVLRRCTLAAPLLLMAASARAVPIQLPTGFAEQEVVFGLDEPTGIAFIPDGRLLFVEQRTGKVRMVVNGALAATDPVMVVPAVDGVEQEQGLLGITVDPGWPVRPYFYVHYNTTLSAHLRISRFTCTGDVASPNGGNLSASAASRFDILTDVPDNTPDHNGGTVRFGPDGMLYASFGEDYDMCAAQDTSSLLGRILRMDVSALPVGPGGPPAKSSLIPSGNPFSGPDDNARLTWALGLRNPFRFQVDRLTGQLFVGDVGLQSYEEIDWVDVPGRDYGWPYEEGPAAGPAASCPGIASPTLTPGIANFDRLSILGPAAIVSAALYRAPNPAQVHTLPPDYEGDYFYSDYYHGYLRRLHWNGSSWQPAAAVPGQPTPTDWGQGFLTVTDFQQAPDGALWFVLQFDDRYDPQSGSIHRIVPTAPPVAIGDGGGPGIATLSAPRPNPARGLVDVDFTLTSAARVELSVRDLTGRRVRRLAGERLDPGSHHARWDGRDDRGNEAPAGVYFLVLKAEGSWIERHVALVR